jgi:uncharacterized protein with HEPN domain
MNNITDREVMRNIAAHHYGSFSVEFLWDTIENDIPHLREFCVANDV